MRKNRIFVYDCRARKKPRRNTDVSYVPYSLAINDTAPGATQKVWVAETTKAENNEYRNVILKMETPLSFNLGTLVYELSSVDFLDD